jgi:hypothetical protein
MRLRSAGSLRLMVLTHGFAMFLGVVALAVPMRLRSAGSLRLMVLTHVMPS